MRICSRHRNSNGMGGSSGSPSISISSSRGTCGGWEKCVELISLISGFVTVVLEVGGVDAGVELLIMLLLPVSDC